MVIQIFMVHVECSSLDLCFFILLFQQQWSWSPGSNKRQNDLDRRLGWLLQPANIECSKCIGKRPVFCQTLVKRLCAVKNVSKNINQCNCQSNQHASSLSIIPMIGTAQRVAKKNDISWWASELPGHGGQDPTKHIKHLRAAEKTQFAPSQMRCKCLLIITTCQIDDLDIHLD